MRPGSGLGAAEPGRARGGGPGRRALPWHRLQHRRHLHPSLAIPPREGIGIFPALFGCWRGTQMGPGVQALSWPPAPVLRAVLWGGAGLRQGLGAICSGDSGPAGGFSWEGGAHPSWGCPSPPCLWGLPGSAADSPLTRGCGSLQRHVRGGILGTPPATLDTSCPPPMLSSPGLCPDYRH